MGEKLSSPGSSAGTTRRRRVVLLDTSAATSNAGDEVIAKAARRQLEPVVDVVGQLPTHRLPTHAEMTKARDLDPDLYVMAGTNMITGDAYRLTQWPLSPDLIKLLRGRLTVMGGGWWSYDSKRMNAKTRFLYQSLASPELPWSVRDRLTQLKLRDNGIRAVYTGCPTTWDLSAWDTPREGGRLIATVTDYRASPQLDKQWVGRVRHQSQSVRFWPQSEADIEYLARLGVPSTAMVDAGLAALADALADSDGYVGTRLHGGIFALQLGKPALILSVDNRANEMGRDCRLPVATRESLAHSGLPDRRSGEVLLPRRVIQGWLDRIGWRPDAGGDDGNDRT